MREFGFLAEYRESKSGNYWIAIGTDAVWREQDFGAIGDKIERTSKN